MIKIDRQLSIGFDDIACNVGNHFFRGWLDNEITIMPVLDAQEFWPVFLPASGFLPEFCRLDEWHQQFDRSGTIHFFPDDVFNFVNDAQTHWHIGVDTGSETSDHAGSDHEFMTDNFSVRWSLFQSRDKKL